MMLTAIYYINFLYIHNSPKSVSWTLYIHLLKTKQVLKNLWVYYDIDPSLKNTILEVKPLNTVLNVNVGHFVNSFCYNDARSPADADNFNYQNESTKNYI